MKPIVLLLCIATITACKTGPPYGGKVLFEDSARGREQWTRMATEFLPDGYAHCDRSVDFLTCSAARLADYSVLLRTNQGDIHLELWPQHAPNHVRNFLDLCASGFYDGTVFFFVVPGGAIQGGDPTGTGAGRGPRQLEAEFQPHTKHVRGVLSMARWQATNSASSQFFIMHADAVASDMQFSAFGETKSGLDAVDRIAFAPRDSNNRPREHQFIARALVLVRAGGGSSETGPGGSHIYEAQPKHAALRAATPLPFSALVAGDLAVQLRGAQAFADVSEPMDPLETILSENQLHISGPVDVRVGEFTLPERVIPDAAAYEAGPAIRVEATFLAHTGLRNEPFRWTVARPWLVSAQSGVSVDAIRAAIAEKCGEGWEVACARSLCEPNALADQLTAALAARGSTEQVTARIEYLRSRSNELRKAASEQKTRAYELERQIGDLESRDATAQGLKSTTSALAGLSNDPLSGLHAAGAQIRLDAARAKNQQNRESLRRSADDAKQLAAKYETLADRADGMVAPLLERMYSTSGN